MVAARLVLPDQYQQLPDDVLFTGLLNQLIQQQLLADQVTGVPTKVRFAMENEERSLMASAMIDQVVNDAVTDEALQAAYDAQYANVEPGTEYNASHILVATEEEALAAKARIDAGEDFAAVAAELSSDNSAANGGNLGWFSAGMMVEPFETAVMALEPGQVSDPVQTQFGWHLITLLETRPTAIPTLDEVRGDLTAAVQQSAVETLLADLEAAADITRPEEGAFDPALMSNFDLLKD
jgi:peptidyl-prolyl cis-trans isomerase C